MMVFVYVIDGNNTPRQCHTLRHHQRSECNISKTHVEDPTHLKDSSFNRFFEVKNVTYQR